MNKNLLALNIGEDFKIAPGVGIGQATQFKSIGGLISAILPNVYILAGLILLFFLIFGGLAIILGSGKGNEEQVEKGKKVLTGTLIGFVIVFASYWIVELLEIITGIEIFSWTGPNN